MVNKVITRLCLLLILVFGSLLNGYSQTNADCFRFTHFQNYITIRIYYEHLTKEKKYFSGDIIIDGETVSRFWLKPLLQGKNVGYLYDMYDQKQNNAKYMNFRYYFPMTDKILETGKSTIPVRVKGEWTLKGPVLYANIDYSTTVDVAFIPPKPEDLNATFDHLNSELKLTWKYTKNSSMDREFWFTFFRKEKDKPDWEKLEKVVKIVSGRNEVSQSFKISREDIAKEWEYAVSLGYGEDMDITYNPKASASVNFIYPNPTDLVVSYSDEQKFTLEWNYKSTLDSNWKWNIHRRKMGETEWIALDYMKETPTEQSQDVKGLTKDLVRKKSGEKQTIQVFLDLPAEDLDTDWEYAVSVLLNGGEEDISSALTTNIIHVRIDSPLLEIEEPEIVEVAVDQKQKASTIIYLIMGGILLLLFLFFIRKKS